MQGKYSPIHHISTSADHATPGTPIDLGDDRIKSTAGDHVRIVLPFPDILRQGHAINAR